MSPSSLALFLSLLCTLTLVQAHVRVFNLRAKYLPDKLLGTADGYVQVFCNQEDLGKTKVKRDTRHPWWQEEFNYFLAEQDHQLRLEVFDHDLLFDDQLGVCQVPIKTGTHDNECKLQKGGTLYFSYTLQ